MSTLNTVIKPDMQFLAYSLTDPLANLVYNQAFPAIDAGDEIGQYRKKDVRTFFRENKSKASKFTTPQLHNTTDTLVPFKIDPIADGFELSNADLGNPMKYGYQSAAAWINDELSIHMFLQKKIKEQALATFVETNGNFAGATYYANATTAWSTVGTADTGADIAAGKEILRAGGALGNAGIINQKTLGYLKRNVLIKGDTTVSGENRSALDQRVTVEYLMNVWDLQYLWVAGGGLITDSSDPTDDTTADIWGNYMLLFNYSPVAATSPQQPAWMKHLFWRPNGEGETNEGWIVNETFDPKPGGVGVREWGIWNYYTFLSHAKHMAYRIDNLY